MADADADADADAPAEGCQNTSIVVYKPETERFRLNLRPSAIGVSAGLIAANMTHAIMDRAVQATSSTAAAGVHTIGFVAEKIVEYTMGPTAGMTVMMARHVAADTTRNSIRAYSPLTAMVASAAVGTTTALAVTAGEAVVGTAAPIIAGAAGAAARAVASAAGAIYNAIPSRRQLWSLVPQMPSIRITGVQMKLQEPVMPPPTFGATIRTDFPSSPNYEGRISRIIASASRFEDSRASAPATPDHAPTAPPSTPAPASTSAEDSDADAIPKITI
jgi:hypothetical protein